MPLSASDVRVLLDAARAVCGEFPLRREFTAGSCAAAILSSSGKVFTGICIDVSCGIGFCAEHAAVAEMLKARETRILGMVAVGGEPILPPCGRCRELVVQINRDNLDAEVILAPGRTRLLRDLLPENWFGDPVA